MDFSFSSEQEAFKQMLHKFSNDELLPHYTKWDREGKLPRHLWKKLGELGVNGLRIPLEYDGSGADCITTGIAAEEIGRGDFNLTYAVMLNALNAEILVNHASETLKRKWLPVMASGEKIMGIAVTEPDAGTDAARMKTTAIKKGNSYILNGEKSGISVAVAGDAFIVFAKTEPDQGSRGISAFVVPADLHGVERKAYEDLGNIPIGRGSIYLHDVEVPAANLIGMENKGFSQVMNGFDLSRLLIGLQCIGCATQSLNETIEHVKQRESFGKPLATYQGVAFPLVHHHARMELIKTQAYRGLWLRDHDKKHTKEAAMIKWLAPVYSQEAIHECITLNGHYAYTKEMPHEQRLRDVIGLEIGDGTAQANKLVIAREVFGKDFKSY